jgi:quinol monooxygenase YgiN
MLLRTFLLALPLALIVGGSEVRAEEENPIVTLVRSKLKDPAKPFAMVVTFKVKAGQEQAFEEAFAPCIVATRKSPGCLAYDLNREVDDSSAYTVYEKYSNLKALEDHARAPHVVKLLGAIPTLIDGEPSVRVYSVAGE